MHLSLLPLREVLVYDVKTLMVRTFLNLGIDGARLLFLVSARTNERHHHHAQTQHSALNTNESERGSRRDSLNLNRRSLHSLGDTKDDIAYANDV